MATMVGKESDIIKLLHDLIELDYDAIEAYDAAITRLKGSVERTTLASFRDDHRRHVDDLSVLLRGMGGKVPEGADIKGVLTKGKVVIGALMGDHAILTAMKSNEDDTNTAYERATARGDVPSNVLDVLRGNLADERRHRAWIEARIQIVSAQPHAR